MWNIVNNFDQNKIFFKERVMKKQKRVSTFTGAIAIVTGGASGIGRALTIELAARGAVVVIADLQLELATKLASDLTSSGAEVYAKSLDVTNYEAVDLLVAETMSKHGRLDYIFNNAGVMFMGDMDKYCIDDWNFTVDVNLRGVINGVQASYKRMSDQGFGHIINTASMSGLIPTAGSIGYTTTKHAVIGLSQGLLVEAAERNISVSAFCPGVIRTPIMTGGKYGRDLQNLNADQKKSFLDSIEKIRPMDPKLFAKAALDQVAKKRFLIILPRWNRIFWLLNRFSPSLGLALSSMGYKNIKKSIEK